MTDKKQVKGLLDYISLKPGEDAEYAANTEDYVSGMGLGATEEAKLYAKIGKLHHEIETIKEAIEQIDVTDKTKTLGRPKKQKALGIHQVRALILWHIAQEFPEGIRQDLTNRSMIAYVQKRGKTSQLLEGKSERLWTVGNNESLEQSVSKGKTWWKIDHNWHSDKCYEFLNGVYPKKKP